MSDTASLNKTLEDLDRLIAFADSKGEVTPEEHSEILVGLVKNHRALLISLGFTRQTFLNWSDPKKKPPRPNKRDFLAIKNALVSSGEPEAPHSAPTIEATPTGAKFRNTNFVLYSPEEMHELVSNCETYWILKSLRGFSAGYGGKTTYKYIEQLRENPKLQINLLYVTGKLMDETFEDHEAGRASHLAKSEKTFLEFKNLLNGLDENISNRVNGYELSIQEAFWLGLGLNYEATAILEYKPEYQTKIHRKFDILSELSATTFDKDSDSPNEKGDVFWGQVPLTEAIDLWELWKPLLQSITQKRN